MLAKTKTKKKLPKAIEKQLKSKAIEIDSH